MQRAVSSLLVILFTLWVLPLGYFIKPSQEKVACDGQRAICMCCCHLFKKASNTPGKMMVSCPTQGTSKEASSSGGASNYYVSAKPTVILNSQLSTLFRNQFPLYKSPFLLSLEHVPKF